jgi:hypothetical protein
VGGAELVKGRSPGRPRRFEPGTPTAEKNRQKRIDRREAGGKAVKIYLSPAEVRLLRWATALSGEKSETALFRRLLSEEGRNLERVFGPLPAGLPNTGEKSC